MKKPIYMDYMATTPVDPEVAKAMSHCLEMTGTFGNPASTTHSYGYEATDKVIEATAELARLIHADPREIVWTSGATESNNLAIKGAAAFYHRKGKHLITVSTEHKAVLDTCAYLETQGYSVTYLNPDKKGRLDLACLKKAIRSDTLLISVMHVNNETGVIQDLAAISEIAHASGVLFHSDAAQSLGRLKIDVRALDIDLMSFSGHKIYGPKGIGALYVRRQPRIRLTPLIHGGGHQNSLRSGTLPTHQIVGMGVACRLVRALRDQEQARIRTWRQRFLEAFSVLQPMLVQGDEANTIPGCLNVAFNGIDAEQLIACLPGLAISSGSACNTVNPDPSHVLVGMGLTRAEANAAIRMSVGRYTTDQDVEVAIEYILEAVQRLRATSPIKELS